MQIMLQGGNKHQGWFVTLALSYQYGHKNSVAYFHFEQLSIIPVVSFLLTFNKHTASGVLSFSIHHFYVSKYSQWKWTQVYIRTFEKKQTKNERWKENHRKTNYFFGKCATSQVRFFIAFAGAQPEIFLGRGGFVKLGHFDKHFLKKSRKKAPQRKILEFFLLDTFKSAFWMANLT